VELPNETKGGVAHFSHYFANALVERGHDVTMFTFSPAFAESRYAVRTLPDANRANRFRPFRFAAALARTDFSGFDVVHTFGDCYLMGGCRVPHVRTFSGSARDELRTAKSPQRKAFQAALIPLEEWASRVADVSVGISENTRLRLPRVSRVIPCGVDVSRFTPGAKDPEPSVLFVGTSGGRKRGQWLADVFAREVLPKVPGAKLWTVAERDIEGEGVVNFGRVSVEELADLYRRAWVFCLPSTYEGFGVPYIEALASGTAVAATPNPGAVEVLRGGEFGVIAQDDTLGAELADLLLDTGRREDLARRGLDRADDFSWGRVTAAYEAVYAEAISRSVTGRGDRALVRTVQ
jgi:glycosyltransferase involved in cell wall biosynthesis